MPAHDKRITRSLISFIKDYQPDEIVHIGDLEFTDIIGAKRAGYYAIRFVGVTPMGENERTIADHVTADFCEVPRLIETL